MIDLWWSEFNKENELSSINKIFKIVTKMEKAVLNIYFVNSKK